MIHSKNTCKCKKHYFIIMSVCECVDKSERYFAKFVFFSRYIITRIYRKIKRWTSQKNLQQCYCSCKILQCKAPVHFTLLLMMFSFSNAHILQTESQIYIYKNLTLCLNLNLNIAYCIAYCIVQLLKSSKRMKD